MQLESNIEKELWETIKKNYESENYSSAILDSVFLLTETIRNKTGLEGDGNSLVGQAFGGENPKIQLNKLQTESEKNIQSGIQQLLRGIYTGIRNPRSHDKFHDTKQNAEAIISFINYLLKIIDKSKLNFEKTEFIKRIFDDHFVRTKEYSQLLINEIPKRQRLDIAIEIILKRNEGNIYNLEIFMNTLFENLRSDEIKQVYKIISEDLKNVKLDYDLSLILNICPAKYWKKINKAVRIRIENMLISDFLNGKYDLPMEMLFDGYIATWIKKEHIKNFEQVNYWTEIIVDKMKSENENEKNYAKKYFWDKICSLNYNNIDYWLEKYIRVSLQKNDEKIVKDIAKKIIYDESHPWWKIFEKELKEYPDIKYLDDIPF